MPTRRSSSRPARRSSRNVRLFAGAKELDTLRRYENAGIPGLTRAIDWGWFRWFMIPIFQLLVWLFHAVRQFRGRDHLPDPDRPRDHVPDRPEAIPVDGRDAQASSRR